MRYSISDGEGDGFEQRFAVEIAGGESLLSSWRMWSLPHSSRGVQGILRYMPNFATEEVVWWHMVVSRCCCRIEHHIEIT